MEYNITGTKYNKDLTIQEIAKLVRADIKQAIKNSLLPKGTRVSVRIQRYSMGQSLNLVVIALPRLIVENFDCNSVLSRFTPEVQDVRSLLTDIANTYNFDNSDSQSDYYHVNFHTSVNFSDDLLSIY